MSGFVYIWYDRKHKRYYIGSHWGSLDDGYICSSSWMKQAYKIRPHDFRRRILSQITTSRKDLLTEEGQWLGLIRKHELGKKYYNLTNTIVYWPGPHTAETKEKMSGRKKGVPFSDEHRENLSLAKKGKPSPKKGIILSDEQKKNMGGWNKGQMTAVETKDKMSQTMKTLKWYTDGIRDLRVRDGEAPEGFRLGRTKGLNNLPLLAEKWSDPEYRQHMSDIHRKKI